MFKNWMNEVDQIIDGICGLSYLDLPDICYRDLFDSGCDPEEAAIEALEYAGYPADLF